MDYMNMNNQLKDVVVSISDSSIFLLATSGGGSTWMGERIFHTHPPVCPLVAPYGTHGKTGGGAILDRLHTATCCYYPTYVQICWCNSCRGVINETGQKGCPSGCEVIKDGRRVGLHESRSRMGTRIRHFSLAKRRLVTGILHNEACHTYLFVVVRCVFRSMNGSAHSG